MKTLSNMIKFLSSNYKKSIITTFITKIAYIEKCMQY